jgi:serine kinase of HPr protein (carbohydrate metabolism regulator)
LPDETDRIHATAIAVGNRGVLIRGPSGSGKSDLALRCLGLAPSPFLHDMVKLVADDQVILRSDPIRTSPQLIATAPPTLRGKLEVRGVGILEVAVSDEAEIVLIADLLKDGQVERFPDPWPKVVLLGLEIPVIRLFPFEASAALKLIAALNMAELPRIARKP